MSFHSSLDELLFLVAALGTPYFEKEAKRFSLLTLLIARIFGSAAETFFIQHGTVVSPSSGPRSVLRSHV